MFQLFANNHFFPEFEWNDRGKKWAREKDWVLEIWNAGQIALVVACPFPSQYICAMFRPKWDQCKVLNNKKNIYSMQNNLECDTTAAAAANSSSDYTFWSYFIWCGTDDLIEIAREPRHNFLFLSFRSSFHRRLFPPIDIFCRFYFLSNRVQRNNYRTLIEAIAKVPFSMFN